MDSYVSESPSEPYERRNGRTRRKSEWAGMDSVVREADEKKVKDCKEDIDTLLVFAGLFSAVLTAFVIESYQTLQPDPSTQVIGLLTQISSQLTSYALTHEFANSTAEAISQIAVFKPPPSIVKVNALWFASLICSLVTASLGMLVKQWLREYLSGDYYSPQARLRARQFRHGGLVAWKVYDVAALLPLLLQVALGLFFLGLCIFTHSIHPSVGWTSIPLVLAWLLVLLLTTIAPAFSARCPYKVTFLISGLRVIRRWARHMVSRTHCWSRRPPTHGSRGISVDTLSQAHDSQSTLPHFAQSYSFLRTRKVLEEEDALISEKNDINILLTIDSMLSDDILIGTMFREHIWQLHSPGEDVVDFVLRIMGRRLQRGRRVLPSDLPLADLRPLKKHAWIGLTGILADALHNEIYQEMHSPDDDSVEHRVLRPWMHAMLKIVMSSSGYTFQQSEAEILVYCLLYDPTNTVTLMHGTRRRVTADDCTDILRMCRRTLAQFQPTAVMACTLHIIQWCIDRDLTSCDTLERSVTSILFNHEGVLNIADIAVDVLIAETQGQVVSGRTSHRWHEWMDDVLRTIIYAWTLLREDDEEDERRIADICQAVGLLCVNSPEFMSRFLLCVARSVDNGRNSFLCHRLLAKAMAHSCITDRDYYSILDHFIAIAKGLNDGEERGSILDPVHLYHIASHIFTHRRRSIPKDTGQLQMLSTHLLTSLRAYESAGASPELTESCSVIVNSLGSDDQDTGMEASQTLTEDLEATWSSDDSALGHKQRALDKRGSGKGADSWLPDAAEVRCGTLPGDAVLASLAAAGFEDSEVLHSTPARPHRPTRRQSTSSRPRIPPLLLRKDST